MPHDVHASPRLHGDIAVFVGLCPLLALAPDAAHALLLAVAIVLMAMLVLTLAVSIRFVTPGAAHWPVHALALAAAAGSTQLLLDALGHGVHAVTALGVPLIAANLVLWTRGALPFSIRGESRPAQASTESAEPFGFRTDFARLARNAVTAAAIVLLLGALRELFARGTLFASASPLFGASWPLPSLRLAAADHGLLLFTQPAGALFALACLLAALQAWRHRSGSHA